MRRNVRAAVDETTRRMIERLPGGAIDLGLTAVVTVASVGPTVLARQPWWVVLLSALASVPVWWRRRAPVPTFLIVGPAITLLACAPALPPQP
ncbi:DUF7134 domain-containing protein [Nocardia brasiliensis]|uniref:DUF7134 domain-containing protein n=1 Tax=Nocardia brasiliensis TaxID=37326 RepID=UPI0024590172|nr:hypothetical protein [Nocardia brasiliensis]